MRSDRTGNSTYQLIIYRSRMVMKLRTIDFLTFLLIYIYIYIYIYMYVYASSNMAFLRPVYSYWMVKHPIVYNIYIYVYIYILIYLIEPHVCIQYDDPNQYAYLQFTWIYALKFQNFARMTFSSLRFKMHFQNIKLLRFDFPKREYIRNDNTYVDIFWRPFFIVKRVWLFLQWE